MERMEVIPTILDSGDRREFETGAVRDMAEGKGRCDLMPLEQVAEIAALDIENYSYTLDADERAPSMNRIDRFLINIHHYQMEGETDNIKRAIGFLLADNSKNKWHTLLELSKHFEGGAVKYGERNWEKGLPENCYIDSAVRHYLKWRAGHTDEPHYIACLWNLICLWWTHENITTADKGDET